MWHKRRTDLKKFFKQKTAYEIASGDWSSDVCSSDLTAKIQGERLDIEITSLEYAGTIIPVELPIIWEVRLIISFSVCCRLPA